MAEPDEASGAVAAEDETMAPRRQRRWPLVLAIVLGVILIGLTILWASREEIAGNYVGAELKKNGLPATYEIVRIGPVRQILKKVVIGNPQRPDMTIEQVQVSIRYRFGFPTVGRIVAVKPRLYGSWRGGQLSFGTLDKVLFKEDDRKREFRLPNLDVAIGDGRAYLDTDHGPVGVKLEGAGRLRNGFLGTFAALAPNAIVGGCGIERASLYGAIAVNGEKPRFNGPLRVQGVRCPDGTLVRKAALQIDGRLDKSFDGGEGKFVLDSEAATLAGVSASSLSGRGSLAYRKNALTANYDLAGRQLATSAFAASELRTTGSVRSQNGLARFEIDGELEGRGFATGRGLDRSLAGAQQSTQGTLLAPMLAQIRSSLQRETPGSRLAASYLYRGTESASSLVIPSASVRGGSGATLLSLSRFQLTSSPNSTPMLSGNLAIGGPGLPQIAGRMQRPAGGSTVLRLTMAEYSAGGGALAIPQLMVAQGPGGALGFVGQARLSGPLPGGSARNLVLPLDGNYSSAAGLSLWRKCTPVSFDSLSYENLTLERRGLTLCPPPGGAIVRSTSAGTRFAAGAPSLDLAGRLGSTPIRIDSGAVGFAIPGILDARSVNVALGPAATASRFHLGRLTAQVGKEIIGRFEGTEMRLHAVPMDLLEAKGAWRFARGTLSINGADFRLIDRRADARFQPLRGTGGTVTLRGNQVTAVASLAEPRTGRQVTRADIRHDLASGRGQADLTMAGLTFDRSLQPADVSRLFLGAVANVSGTIRGTGRIVWDNRSTTSTGQFSTDSLDFAAGFGPVRGASGTVVFTDLLGLVTAPNQKFFVRSMNPGIEVENGIVELELRAGSVLAINSATWPFMGGTLTLQPTTLNMGVSETRRYTLKVDGLDAGIFVKEMGLDDFSATGIFDGMLPLVFDENGGRIVGGLLNSRPPGGNISYTGELSRKNLSGIANFAFDALRSLDYRQMRIAMDGRLTGELVTRVTMSSVRQGPGAKQNFLTKRVAKLPIQFSINVRGPFYQIIRTAKSLRDPKFTRSPISLGLLDANGQPIDLEVINPPIPGDKPPPVPPSVRPRTPPASSGVRPRNIQRPDSR